MLIHGRDYRIAVLILMMEKEFAVSKLTLASLLRSIGDESGIVISILLNGSRNEQILQYLSEVPHVRTYASEANLGIAGGRNFLFQQPEAAGSDIIMLLDNDVFVPVDYVRQICEFLVAQPNPGIVGPSMGWAKSFRRVLDIDPASLPLRHKDITIPAISSAQIKTEWLDNPDPGRLFHMGTRHWFWLYALASPSTWGRLYRRLKTLRLIEQEPHFMVKSDPNTLKTIRAGNPSINVVNIAGAGQVFFTKLLASVGLIEPAIFPGWFEDSEFSIRTLRKGYVNVTSLDTWLIHGTDRRHHGRDHSWQTYIHCRGRTILVRRSIRNPLFRALCLAELLVFIVIREIWYSMTVDKQSFQSVKLGVRAWWSGLQAKLKTTSELVGPIQDAIRRAHATPVVAPLVSVITPSFNQGRFISGTLDCIQNQTYRHIEHLVIDGGSTDETLNVLKNRSRVKFISEKDRGQSDAINKGLRLAKGSIIGWLNSDDLYASEQTVEMVVKYFEANPQAEVVYGRGDFVDVTKSPLREAYVHQDDTNLLFSFAWSVGILQPAVFFRRSVIEKVGLLDIDNHTCMDYEYWVRMTHAGIRMRFLNTKLALATFHDDMKSSGMRGKQIEDICAVNYRYYGFVHPRWINVYAKYIVTKNGQIIEASSDLERIPEISEKISAMEHELFLAYNSSPESIRALLNPKYCDHDIAVRSLDVHLPAWKVLVQSVRDVPSPNRT